MKPERSVAIVGLGYVGLPLALRFAKSGLKVLGVDVDLAKIRALAAGQSKDVDLSRIWKA
jgi:UDP-N-acetyl-D-glucosamine dehydrogenase